MRTVSRRQVLAGLGALSISALALTGCNPAGQQAGASGGGTGTFKILQYEDPTTPQGQGWKKAVEIFKAKHPDVTVDVQQTSFDAFRQNAKILLTGNDVPDVVEFNKGNADGGQLASQGLLEPLNDAVSKFGWDKKVSGSMAAFAKYNEEGMAGDGDWYGIPNVGEYVYFYYNKAKFKKAGISDLPTDMASFEVALDKLKAAGEVPISSSASTSQGFNQMWVWYSLVSAEASRKEIDDFMFVRDKVDFHSGAWKTGTERFQQWIDKGYVGDKLGGLSFEQATVSFLSEKAAMLPWNNGMFARIRKDAKFDWGFFIMPGSKLSMGSSGHLWGVPAKAKNKDLAYDWIETTLNPEVQNLIGQKGGLPLAGDINTISDPLTKELTEKFNEVVKADTLSFYPDYPVPGFLDFIQNHMQAMSNKNETADGYLDALQGFYDKGTKK
jgi:raffinose/stachyose/melibiose transport system substrate-binding protein